MRAARGDTYVVDTEIAENAHANFNEQIKLM